MLLERNLFCLYRLIIKTPLLIFLAALALLLFIAFTQLLYLRTLSNTIDLTPALFEYMMQKHQQRQMQNNITKIADRITANKSGESMIVSEQYALLDDATVLHFRWGKIESAQIQLNYSYSFNQSDLPFMLAVRNQHLVYLGQKQQQYLKKHGITYDLITLPVFTLNSPPFTFFFQKDFQISEIAIASFSTSYMSLQSRFADYRKEQHITDNYEEISQLYLSFFYERDGSIHLFTLNFFHYLGLQLLPSFIIKTVSMLETVIILFIASAFTGLLFRYAFIAAYSLFLLIYERCQHEQTGWMHQYLAILRRRDRIGTLKMTCFYMAANLGMPLLLAFGAYCILAKLVTPMLPLLVEEYSAFFLKSLMCVEIFHYLMSRTRTATRFFPLLSYIISFTVLTLCALKRTPMLMLLNLHLTLHVTLFLFFCIVEKSIVEDNTLSGVYCPSMSRPRMLFYAGFDISWEKSLPPIWTYFTSWFDYSHFAENERCFIEKDYQLLYGRMLGLNDRQEIPEEDYEMQEMPMLNQPSNEMHLIEE